MTITPELLRHLTETNRRLLVAGRWSRDDAVRGRTFEFPADTTQTLPSGATLKVRRRLNAKALFEAVQPELRFMASDQPNITIGEMSFTGIQLQSPAQSDGNGWQSLPLTLQSPLLRPGPGRQDGDPYLAIQDAGGELFRLLVKDLTALAPYGHPAFTRGLTEVIRRYVPAAQQLEAGPAKIDAARLVALIETDADVRGAMLHTLTCLPDDEPLVRRQLTELLDKSIGAYSADANTRGDQVSKTLERLLELKENLLRNRGPAIERLKSGGLGWVSGDSTVPRPAAFRFPAPDHGYGADFAADYRGFREASDAVSRFVRCTPIHSFLVCWLAAKYLPHTSLTAQHAADEMFRLGCKDQLYRKIRDSGRTLERQVAQGDAALREVAEQNKADPDLVRNLNEVQDRFRRSYRFTRAYTREQLRGNVADLFGQLCQLAAGKVSELHKANEALTADLTRVKDALQDEVQRQKQSQGFEGTEEDLKVDRAAMTATLQQAFPNQTAVIAAWEQATPADVAAAAGLSAAAAKRHFAAAFARASAAAFVQAWKDNKGTIEAEKQRNQELLKLWLGIGAEGQGERSGDPVSVVSTTTLPPVAPARLDEILTAQQEKLRRRLRARAPKTVTISTPASLQGNPALVGGRATGTHAVNGKPVASVTVNGPTTTLTRDPEAAAAAAATPAPQPGDPVAMHLQSDAGQPFEVDVRADISLAAAAAAVAPDADPRTNDLLRQYDELAKLRETLAAKFLETDPANASFRRSTLALDFGRLTLAAPESQVSLNREDLSNSVGIILQMLQHLGEPKFADPDPATRPADGKPVPRPTALKLDPNTLAVDVADGPTADQIKRINLSDFYPLADQDALTMAAILTYHYGQCQAVRAMEPYLREVRELREFFDAMEGTDARVLVAADRLADFVAANPMLAQDHASLVCYAARAAFTGPPDAPATDAATTSLQALSTAIKAGLAPGARKLFARLQIPAVVLADNVNPNPAGLVFPLFSSQTVSLPELGAKSKTTVAVDRLVQARPLLPWAASLLQLTGQPAFGSALGGALQDLSPTDGINVHLKENLKLPIWQFVNGEADVFTYLRKCLTQSHHAARGELIVLHWINLGLLMTNDAAGNEPTFVPGAGLPNRALQPVLKALYQSKEPGFTVELDRKVLELRTLTFGGAPPASPTEGATLSDATITPRLSGAACHVPGSNFTINNHPVTGTWIQNF